ncbi:efflux RND transporter periplasmic adaptor subunit [Acetobacter nitrogenifigens]|nr:efflux RND transporter periplasmic adaptor subunit [Acetobacter nitrogenifigens]
MNLPIVGRPGPLGAAAPVTGMHRPKTSGRYAVAAAAMLSCSGFASQANAENNPAHRNARGQVVVEADSALDKTLVVTPVTASIWNRGVRTPGQIVAEPSRSVTVFSPVTGLIQEVTVNPGDHVQAGQILARVISGDAAQATSDEAKARAGLEFAQRAFTRAQGVLAAGGGAQKDLENARSNLLQAQAEEDRAQARLSALQSASGADGIITLKAPIEGDVSAVNATAGMNVVDITQPLIVMANSEELWAIADVPERDIRGVTVGQQVNVAPSAFPNVILHSTVSAIDPIVQPNMAVLRVRSVLPNVDGALRPNMYAAITVMEPQPPTISVPQSALLMNNDKVTVFVRVAPHVFERRAVEIVYDEGDQCRVTSGLSPSDSVVTVGAILLNDD